MPKRACAVSILAISLLASAGVAAPVSNSPRSLCSNVSSAVSQGQWQPFLECFTPGARKTLMVSLARPVFAAASAHDELESDLSRRLDSLGMSRSMILSGTDLSRQARFVELLTHFADQNDISIPSIFTDSDALQLSRDSGSASFSPSQQQPGQSDSPVSFSVISNNGSYQFDISPDNAQAMKQNATPSHSPATMQASNSPSWVKPGLFPDYRSTLRNIKNLPSQDPGADWTNLAPRQNLDANPGEVVLAYFPSDEGNNLHVCMLMGLSNGTAKVLTTDGTIINNLPGSLVTPISFIQTHVGSAPQNGDKVLAIRNDGGAFYGSVSGFENGAPIVSYFDSGTGRQMRTAMNAAIPLGCEHSPIFQMLAFSCDGRIESGLCVASYDGGVWLATQQGLESRSNDQVQVLSWVGTDTQQGVELFRPANSSTNPQHALAYSGNFLPSGANFEIEVSPSLYPNPQYRLSGVDTSDEN